MFKLIIIGAGGFLGAIFRYVLSGFFQQYFKPLFPGGTLIVNVIGCFLLGGVMYMVQSRGMFHGHLRLFLTIGLLGALTTFSTFGYETLELINSNLIKLTLLNIFGNIVLGVFSVWLGVTFVKIIGL
ncbi:MAG: fluoride efflux transporter CrcB [FCB group bacterium]|nr:fluoride efflux transporter CrcB [FCB group bacterium]